jgi:hypothetical protein
MTKKSERDSLRAKALWARARSGDLSASDEGLLKTKAVRMLIPNALHLSIV